MSKKLSNKKSQFSPNQRVYFVGGIGTIKRCHFNTGKWTYAIEMPLGL